MIGSIQQSPAPGTFDMYINRDSKHGPWKPNPYKLFVPQSNFGQLDNNFNTLQVVPYKNKDSLNYTNDKQDTSLSYFNNNGEKSQLFDFHVEDFDDYLLDDDRKASQNKLSKIIKLQTTVEVQRGFVQKKQDVSPTNIQNNSILSKSKGIMEIQEQDQELSEQSRYSQHTEKPLQNQQEFKDYMVKIQSRPTTAGRSISGNIESESSNNKQKIHTVYIKEESFGKRSTSNETPQQEETLKQEVQDILLKIQRRQSMRESASSNGKNPRNNPLLARNANIPKLPFQKRNRNDQNSPIRNLQNLADEAYKNVVEKHNYEEKIQQKKTIYALQKESERLPLQDNLNKYAINIVPPNSKKVQSIRYQTPLEKVGSNRDGGYLGFNQNLQEERDNRILSANNNKTNINYESNGKNQEIRIYAKRIDRSTEDLFDFSPYKFEQKSLTRPNSTNKISQPNKVLNTQPGSQINLKRNDQFSSKISQKNFNVINFPIMNEISNQTITVTTSNQIQNTGGNSQKTLTVHRFQNGVAPATTITNTQTNLVTGVTMVNAVQRPTSLNRMRPNTTSSSSTKQQKLIDSLLGKTFMPKGMITTMDRYEVGAQLGQGSYAVVKLAVDSHTREKVAIKSYDKFRLLDPQKRNNVKREIAILQRLQHNNIIRLVTTIDTRNSVNLVMEYIGSKSLRHFLKQKNGRKLEEREAKVLFEQIVSAISYCHSNLIIHRDIKLENILISDDGKNIQLIDFGFSIKISEGQKLNLFCGTPSYMSPEIVLKKQYDGAAADVWALGVLLFVILSGKFPYKGQDDHDLFKKISKGELKMPPFISSGCSNLIQRILKPNPEDRITAKQILADPWMTK